MAKAPTKKPTPAKKAAPKKAAPKKAAPKKKTGPKGPTKDTIDDTSFKKLIEMAKIQCTAEEISSIMEMSVDTLDRRLKGRGFANFADFYGRYSADGKMSLRRLQKRQAETSVAMSMHLGKHQLGQTEKQVPQQTTIILNGTADDL